MKHNTKAIFGILLVLWFLMPVSVFAIDPGSDDLSGWVYESDWGPVYFVTDSNGEWIFCYYTPGETEEDSRYGVMTGTRRETRQGVIYTLDWSETDWTHMDPTGYGTAELVFTADNMFTGEWYDGEGNYGGDWTGSLTGQLEGEDWNDFWYILYGGK
jgi:hypothetical protein